MPRKPIKAVPSEDVRPLLTVQQVADRLGVHPHTVYSLVRTGELPAVRISRLMKISPAALDQYIAQSTWES